MCVCKLVFRVPWIWITSLTRHTAIGAATAAAAAAAAAPPPAAASGGNRRGTWHTLSLSHTRKAASQNELGAGPWALGPKPLTPKAPAPGPKTFCQNGKPVNQNPEYWCWVLGAGCTACCLASGLSAMWPDGLCAAVPRAACRVPRSPPFLFSLPFILGRAARRRCIRTFLVLRVARL
jgi:hypothetical protein